MCEVVVMGGKEWEEMLSHVGSGEQERMVASLEAGVPVCSKLLL